MKNGKVKFHFMIKNEVTGEEMKCYRVFNDWDTTAWKFLNSIWRNGFVSVENL